MKLLGLDFETQTDKAATTNVTEVGAVLYEYNGYGKFLCRPGTTIHGEMEDKSVVYSGQFPPVPLGPLTEIDSYSAFCWDKSYPPQTEKIIEITGITDGLLKEQGEAAKPVMEKLVKDYITPADVIFAHKTAFDKTILEAQCQKFHIELPRKEWICTLTNFPWPGKYTCHKLSHLAYEHGIMVDPSTLHRAMNDVQLMMRLISTKYDIDKVLEYARMPWTYLKIAVPGPWTDGGEGTGFAKQLGFSYECVKGTDYPKWPKTWVTRVKTAEQHFKIGEAARTNKIAYRVDKIEGLN